MNRREFMAQLERLLGELPESERVEALRFYNDYFDEAGPENEAGVIRELGSPGRVAAVIRANLDGNQDRGEFTEQGYRDNVQENTPNYPGPAKPVQKERTGSRIFGDRGGFRESQDRQRDAGKMESARKPEGPAVLRGRMLPAAERRAQKQGPEKHSETIPAAERPGTIQTVPAVMERPETMQAITGQPETAPAATAQPETPMATVTARRRPGRNEGPAAGRC